LRIGAKAISTPAARISNAEAMFTKILNGMVKIITQYTNAQNAALKAVRMYFSLCRISLPAMHSTKKFIMKFTRNKMSA